jgi:hypothetical protein
MMMRTTIPHCAVALCAIALLFVAAGSMAQDLSAATHVASATRLVDQLDLANTDYDHGQGSVTWTGKVESHTDCSGFIDHLLMHDDGLTPDDFKRWFDSRRPTAARYHDAIVEGRGFTRLMSVTDLKSGDLIAIKYLTRHDNTGHIMLLVDAPRRMAPSAPFVDGTTQWAVTVIDSSESGHGPTDTRHKLGADGRDHDGLGRGVFRLYANAQGGVTGFAWSTLKASRFVPPEDEDLVLGRFIAGYHP